jgi:hypothetical protein
METDHERSISILQNQLQTSEQEIEQLKTRIKLLQQTIFDNEKLTSNSDSSHIGIKSDSNRDNTLAWSTYERQQGGEVNILSILFLVYLFLSLVIYFQFSRLC